MAFLRSQRHLLLLVALLFAVGHAHQVLGRFELHHHDGEVAHHHDHGDHDEHDGAPDEDEDHALEHQAFACIAPAVVVQVIVELDSVALVDMSAATMPEAPVAGIEHPPQLGC